MIHSVSSAFFLFCFFVVFLKGYSSSESIMNLKIKCNFRATSNASLCDSLKYVLALVIANNKSPLVNVQIKKRLKICAV